MPCGAVQPSSRPLQAGVPGGEHALAFTLIATTPAGMSFVGVVPVPVVPVAVPVLVVPVAAPVVPVAVPVVPVPPPVVAAGPGSRALLAAGLSLRLVRRRGGLFALLALAPGLVLLALLERRGKLLRVVPAPGLSPSRVADRENPRRSPGSLLSRLLPVSQSSP